MKFLFMGIVMGLMLVQFIANIEANDYQSSLVFIIGFFVVGLICWTEIKRRREK